MPDQRSAKPDPNDAKYCVEAFKILSNSKLKPEDDPAEWIFPEDDPLRDLAADIMRYDSTLSEILMDMAVGDTPKSEMVRKVSAWSSMMGGRPAHGNATPAPKEPWLA